MGMIVLYNGTASGHTLTSNASANTLGTKVELVASSTAAVERVILTLRPSTTTRDFQVALFTGGPGFEVELARVAVRINSLNKFLAIPIPVAIASGTRISAACQDPTGSGQMFLQSLVGQTAISGIVPAGATSATHLSNGLVSITAGNGTWGTAGTLIASTAADYNCFVVTLGETNASAADAMWRIKDDGTVIYDSGYHRITNGDPLPQVVVFYHQVASGSLLEVEANASAASLNLRVGITGMNVPSFGGGGSAINIGSLMDSIAYAADSTSRSVEVIATTLSDGTAKTDLAYNTSGLTASYKRGPTGAVTSITLATQTSTGAYSSGGFVHLSNGRYRLDVPNAALASGADYVTFDLGGVSGVRISQVRVDLTGGDPRAATVNANVTQWSSTNVATPDTAGYPKVTIKTGTGTGEVSMTSGVVNANAAQISGDSVAADNLEAMLDGTGGVTLSAVLGSNAITSASIAADAIGASELATDAVTEIANAVVEAEITALKSYNRSANTTATIDGPTSGTTSLTVTTDAAYEPVKTF